MRVAAEIRPQGVQVNPGSLLLQLPRFHFGLRKSRGPSRFFSPPEPKPPGKELKQWLQHGSSPTLLGAAGREEVFRSFLALFPGLQSLPPPPSTPLPSLPLPGLL